MLVEESLAVRKIYNQNELYYSMKILYEWYYHNESDYKTKGTINH